MLRVGGAADVMVGGSAGVLAGGTAGSEAVAPVTWRLGPLSPTVQDSRTVGGGILTVTSGYSCNSVLRVAPPGPTTSRRWGGVTAATTRSPAAVGRPSVASSGRRRRRKDPRNPSPCPSTPLKAD